MNRNRDGIMTGAIVFIVIALAAILLLHDSGVDMGNSMFMSYVDVVLTSDGGETRRFLAVAYSFPAMPSLMSQMRKIYR